MLVHVAQLVAPMFSGLILAFKSRILTWRMESYTFEELYKTIRQDERFVICYSVGCSRWSIWPWTASFPDASLAAKVVSAQGRKGKRKEERRLASLLSPSRGPPRTRPHFLVFRARLLATGIQASEEETDADWLDG